jgi:hypothetical protein
LQQLLLSAVGRGRLRLRPCERFGLRLRQSLRTRLRNGFRPRLRNGFRLRPRSSVGLGLQRDSCLVLGARGLCASFRCNRALVQQLRARLPD